MIKQQVSSVSIHWEWFATKGFSQYVMLIVQIPGALSGKTHDCRSLEDRYCVFYFKINNYCSLSIDLACLSASVVHRPQTTCSQLSVMHISVSSLRNLFECFDNHNIVDFIEETHFYNQLLYLLSSFYCS